MNKFNGNTANTNFRIEKSSADALKIVFAGRLDTDNVARLWNPCISTIIEQVPQSLTLDFKNVDYCDGAGIALIQELRKQQTKNSLECIISNLQDNFKNLLEYIEQQPDKIEQETLYSKKFQEQVGHITVNFLNIFRENITFIGLLSYQLFLTLLKPHKIRWRDFIRFAEEVGPQALPIIALIGFLIGLISTFQAAPSFKDFGVQLYMINLVGLGLVREMGPLLTAVLLAGRTASAFAAEQYIDIGNVTQIDESDMSLLIYPNPVCDVLKISGIEGEFMNLEI
jgi:phospholipid/cholesterol/gamma-HCH transport system permease protein